jgi:hypothetical protein
MARAIRLAPGSEKKVYIAREAKEGAAVVFSSAPQAEAVQVVDDPRFAHETIAVHVGPNRVDHATAKKLERAALEKQERLAKGKRDKGVFEELVADLERPAPAKKRKSDDRGISFQAALVAGALGWLGFCVYLLTNQGIGPAFAGLLGTVFFAPCFAFVLKIFDFFIPEVAWLPALGIVVIGWGAGLGLIDFEKKNQDRKGGAGTEQAPATQALQTPSSASSGTAEVTVTPQAGDWPEGEEAQTIIIASKETKPEAAAIAERAAAKGLESGVIRSDSYTTLLPGFWVAFAEQFKSFQAAEERLPWFHSHGFADAFPELISEAPQEPAGPVTATTVGSVRVGMTIADVERYLVRPDDTREITFSSGPVQQIDWIWHLAKGDFTLQLDAKTETVTGYVAEDPAFFTTSGASVGDSFSP